MMSWLEDNWPKSTLPLALVSLVALSVTLLPQNVALFLIAVQTPIYFLHQFEEYIRPGGFVAFFNKNMLGSNRTDWPLTKTGSFWINIPYIYVAFPVSAFLAGSISLSFGVWTVYFSILNAASHVGMFFRLGYNPGVVVSATLNIPVGVLTLWYLSTHGLISAQAHMVGFAIALVLQGSLMLWGFKVLKPKIAAARGK